MGKEVLVVRWLLAAILIISIFNLTLAVIERHENKFRPFCGADDLFALSTSEFMRGY